MAKTIKFNLLLNENPVRDIKSFQNNFCINDVLDVYENGLLQKWLKVRGFDEYLEKVENIKKNSSIIVELIKVFDIEKDDKEIRESIYSLEFQENRKKSLESFNIKDDDFKNRIGEYHKEYEQLIEAIIEQKENMEFLKVASKEISDKYLKLFELDYKDSYELYKDTSPLMIYAILMNDKTSFFFMQNNIIKEDLYKRFLQKDSYDIKKLKKSKFIKKAETDTNYKWKRICNEPVVIVSLTKNDKVWIDDKKNNDRKSKYNAGNSIGKIFSQLYFNSYASSDKVEYIKISDLPKQKNFKDLKKFKGATDAYWKDLEIVDTKVMILSIPDGTFARSANNLQQELSVEDVNGNFLILDGLAYKSNNDYESIVYMEV